MNTGIETGTGERRSCYVSSVLFSRLSDPVERGTRGRRSSCAFCPTNHVIVLFQVFANARCAEWGPFDGSEYIGFWCRP